MRAATYPLSVKVCKDRHIFSHCKLLFLKMQKFSFSSAKNLLLCEFLPYFRAESLARLEWYHYFCSRNRKRFYL